MDPTGRGRADGNGHVVESLEHRRTSHLPESLTRKPVRSVNSDSGTGFGRNISKKSLDMAIKHMVCNYLCLDKNDFNYDYLII